MLKEFRDFLAKGNALDLAIGVIIGTAFGKIVSALVESVIMPLVGIFGKADFSTWAFQIGGATIRYGVLLTAIIDFVIVAFVLFMIIKAVNRMQKPAAAAPAGPSETDLLIEIRDLLKK